MPASGDTWGISGPAFLLVYVVLAVTATVVALRLRRRLADVPTRPVGGLDRRPYDVAFLNGGADLALCAALSAMRLTETIATAGRGTVVAARRPDSRADELERAVHHAAAAPLPRHRLAGVGGVGSALHRIESRLLDAGLLLPAERRRRIRAAGLWTFAVLALGVARLVAGIENGRPVDFLAALLVLTAAVGLANSRPAPRRSRAGDAALRRLIDEHHALSPAMRPDWTAYGPAGAALAVGVFGVGALWASDPAFAGELALQRVATGGGSSSDSGGCGGGGGGCGGGCGG